jgi:hypothetical protein
MLTRDLIDFSTCYFTQTTAFLEMLDKEKTAFGN